MFDSDCGSEPVSYVTIKVDCTSGLVVEVFNDLDQVETRAIMGRRGNLRALAGTSPDFNRLFKTSSSPRVTALKQTMQNIVIQTAEY